MNNNCVPLVSVLSRRRLLVPRGHVGAGQAVPPDENPLREVGCAHGADEHGTRAGDPEKALHVARTLLALAAHIGRCLERREY